MQMTKLTTLLLATRTTAVVAASVATSVAYLHRLIVAGVGGGVGMSCHILGELHSSKTRFFLLNYSLIAEIYCHFLAFLAFIIYNYCEGFRPPMVKL